MTIGARAFLVGLLVVILAGCASDDDDQAQAATTTTTAPDPAITACPEHVGAVDVTKRRTDVAIADLVLSRDARIVAAAREVERIITDRELDASAVSPELDIDYASAELELARACKVAGYLP